MGQLKKGVARSILKEYESRKERHDKAQGLVDEGKLFLASKLFRENLDWSLKNFGRDHETTVYDQETLAYTLNELGHSNAAKNRGKNEDAKLLVKELFEEARDLDTAALEARIRVEGTPHPSKHLLETQRNLANDYVSLEDYRKAASLFRENYEARRIHPDLGEDDESTIRAGHDLAACFHKQEQFRKAKELNGKILEARIRLKRPDAEIERSRDALYWNNLMIQERSKGNSNSSKKDADGGKFGKMENGKSHDTEGKKTAENQSKVCNGKGIKEHKGGETWKEKPWQGDDASKGNEWKSTDGKKAAAGNEGGETSTGQNWEGNDVWKNNRTWKKNENWKGNEDWKQGDKEGGKGPEKPGSVPNIVFKYVDPRVSGVNQADSDTSSVVSSSNASSVNLQFRRGSGRPKSPQIIDADPGQRRSKPRPKSPEVLQSNAPISLDNLKSTDNNNRKNTGTNRARSLSNNHEKDRPKPPARAKSTSPLRNHYRQLSDAGPGKDDEISAREVGKWFYSLQTETQALLEPLRRTRGKRVKIAILDTGVDIGHPHFATDQAHEPSRRRIKSREDFLNEGGDAQDVCGHGTHSLGILRKVAPEADIYVARVAEDFDHELDPKAVEKAIYRACRDKRDERGVKNWNVDIITMSFGFYGRSKEVQKAIQEALSKPVLVFAAASNNGTMKEVTFPAWLGGVMCINSATANGTPSLFNPDTKAPSNFSILGEDVKSAWIRSPGNPNAERIMSGTSVATPIAAAVAALVLEFVLQSDPESVLLEQLEDLKHQDGMPEVFAKMVRSEKEYRNIVPWALLSATHGTNMVSSRIDHALRRFRGV